MKEINTYLIFNGNCAEAMKFYQKCLNAELTMSPFSEMPGPPKPGTEGRIIHAQLKKGKAVLMASDNMPDMKFNAGDNFFVSINCENEKEVNEYYAALKEGGEAITPPQKMFWGDYFGMLRDKFGVAWMMTVPSTHS